MSKCQGFPTPQRTSICCTVSEYRRWRLRCGDCVRVSILVGEAGYTTCHTSLSRSLFVLLAATLDYVFSWCLRCDLWNLFVCCDERFNATFRSTAAFSQAQRLPCWCTWNVGLFVLSARKCERDVIKWCMETARFHSNEDNIYTSVLEYCFIYGNQMCHNYRVFMWTLLFVYCCSRSLNKHRNSHCVFFCFLLL